jgi:hypothetical protein
MGPLAFVLSHKFLQKDPFKRRVPADGSIFKRRGDSSAGGRVSLVIARAGLREGSRQGSRSPARAVGSGGGKGRESSDTKVCPAPLHLPCLRRFPWRPQTFSPRGSPAPCHRSGTELMFLALAPWQRPHSQTIFKGERGGWGDADY